MHAPWRLPYQRTHGQTNIREEKELGQESHMYSTERKKKYNEAEQNSHGQADNERSFPGSGA